MSLSLCVLEYISNDRMGLLHIMLFANAKKVPIISRQG